MLPADPPELPSRGGIRVGDVGGNVEFNARGDIVGGDKVVNIRTTIQISAEVVTTRPLILASPYRGLNRFEDHDRALFFGRDQLIKSLLTKVGSSSVRLVLGASGSGKSSLVRAGVLPTLSRLVGSSLRYFVLVPDVNPFESLRSSLLGGGFSQSETKTLLGGEPDALATLIQQLQRPGDKWLLFIDQFEEIFTQAEESVRKKFIAALVAIIREPTNSTKVILAMRADFVERLGPFLEFAKLVEENIDLVTDMQPDELRLAIEQPAAQHGVVFQHGLVEEIIKDVQGQAGSLPLLQYTLNLLWEEERKEDGLSDRTLSSKTYRELGGLRGALQKRADEIYTACGKSSEPELQRSQQKLVRQIFLRLVDIATVEGTSDAPWRPVHRRVPISGFQSAEEQAVLNILVNQKLLVSNREKVAASDPDEGATALEATVEVAHEMLFTCWDRLKTWIAEGKHVIFVKNRLADDSQRWKRICVSDRGAAEDELWSGSRLEEALGLRGRNEFVTIVGGLTDDESRFLDLSAALRDERRREEDQQRERELKARRRQRNMLIALAGLLLLAGIVAAIAVSEGRNAQQEESLKLLAFAGRVLYRVPQQSLLLAQRAIERSPSPLAEAESAQQEALTTMQERRRIQIEDAKQWGQGTIGGNDQIWFKGKLSAKLSKDGKYVLLATERGESDNTPPGDVYLLNQESLKSVKLEPKVREDRPKRLEYAGFSSSGNKIYLTRQYNIEIYSIDGSFLKEFEPSDIDQPISMVDGVRDDESLVVVVNNRVVYYIDASTGRTKSGCSGPGVLSAFELSPSGKWAAMLYKNGTASVWALDEKKNPVNIPDGAKVISAVFKPIAQEEIVFTAGDDGTAKLWELGGPEIRLLNVFQHRGSPIVYASFEDTGNRILTMSEDGILRIWDSNSGKLQVTIGKPKESSAQ